MGQSERDPTIVQLSPFSRVRLNISLGSLGDIDEPLEDNSRDGDFAVERGTESIDGHSAVRVRVRSCGELGVSE